MTAVKPTLRIDFVSDVACPWCAVGLASLEKALDEVKGEIDVDLHFQPFELNPSIAKEGLASAPYLKAKYGLSDEQLRSNAARIAERGAAAGFVFGPRPHIWGTLDAHRLLLWADLPGQPAGAQLRLKRALLEAYHRDGRNPSDPDVLLELAQGAGLDAARARALLQTDELTDEVRALEGEWQQRGISGVPAAIVNEQFMISGGQPSEMYVRALRQIARDIQTPEAADVAPSNRSGA